MSSSPAREIFVDRMTALIKAVELENLIPTSPILSARDPSRLLRNGLAVVAYSAFEDFFSSRATEVLSLIDNSRLPFSRLPEKLVEAATVGTTIQAIRFRMGFENSGPDRCQFVQRHAEFLYSTSTSNYRFSPLIFSPYSSNLTIEDIERALSSLLVHEPWRQLFRLAARIGYGGLGLRERLAQMLSQRNEAAHAAEADISIADLRQVPYDLLAASVAFDAVLSYAVTSIRDRSPAADPNTKTNNIADRLSIIFLDTQGQRVREQMEGRSRATKYHTSLLEALKEAVPRAKKKQSLIVIRDSGSRPVDWCII